MGEWRYSSRQFYQCVTVFVAIAVIITEKKVKIRFGLKRKKSQGNEKCSATRRCIICTLHPTGCY
jgi:hypothetical protein